MWSVAAALAQDAPPAGEGTEDVPLAIPAGAPFPTAPAPRPPPAVVRPPEPERAGLEAFVLRDGFARVEDYRRRRLELRTLDRVTGWYTPYSAWGTPFVTHDLQEAVFEGEHRLDVPQTLEALGRGNEADRLRRRIDRNSALAQLGEVVGGTGAVAGLVGILASTSARDPRERELWSLAAIGGGAAMIGGYVFASFPAARSAELTWKPDATFGEGELESDIEHHNVQLANELGLTRR